MKKIFILLVFLFVSIPALAIEIYNDGNYSYQTDSVIFVNNQRELIYTLYAIPTIKDKYYKAKVSQYTTNGYTWVSSIYTLDNNGNYIHTDNTKDLIKKKISSYSVAFISNIKNSFTNCKEEIDYLYCTPKK